MMDAVDIDRRTDTSSTVSRGWDVAAHASALVVGATTAVAVGGPVGWIAWLFPLGPLFVIGLMRVAGRGTPRAFRSLLAFTVGASVIIGGAWLVMRLGTVIRPLAFIFPLALIIFFLGLLNFSMVVISRSIRAARGQLFDYPWIPDRLARRFGLPDRWME